MKDSASSKSLQGILFALGATVIWSGNFIVARGLNQSIEPATLSFLRWGTAFLGLLPFACHSAWTQRAEIRKAMPAIIPMAILGVTAFNTLLYKAAHSSSALNLSLIATSTPVFIILLARFFLNEKLTVRKLSGLSIALAGVLLLISGGDPGRLTSMDFSIGDLWMSLAAVIFAAYSILVRRFRGELSQSVFLLTLFGTGIVFLIPWAGWELLASGPPEITPGAAGAILYVGLGASLASYAMWNSAVKSIGPSLAGLIYYSLPLFSGVAAFVLLDEPMGLIHLASAACILGGILLATRE
ncbi:MAG: DMT family transporter [Desulfomicrobium sp.]|nr:DMT family transporter [Pseudomonadota bacterium]MBV1712097.1 DMT family transporter [Desulfomicrobium sp.]MBU4572735.1 DMT family transporter [Pseudomonadota bacterium]MBU4594730.1 DMT family transporter [Pseudomonadota bacterium]MBV1718655.1 DMT family transporter [Desulfomicrobium sp.]